MEWPDENEPEEEFLSNFFSETEEFEFNSFRPTSFDTDLDDEQENSAERENPLSEYDGYEAALIKLAALDPLDNYDFNGSDAEPQTDSKSSEGWMNQLNEINENDDEFIDIVYNPNPSFNFEYIEVDREEQPTPSAEVEIHQDIPAEFSKMYQSLAEQRFMGSQQSSSDPFASSNDLPRPDISTAFDQIRVLETLRRVALLGAEASTVRQEWFPIVEMEMKPTSLPAIDVPGEPGEGTPSATLLNTPAATIAQYTVHDPIDSATESQLNIHSNASIEPEARLTPNDELTSNQSEMIELEQEDHGLTIENVPTASTTLTTDQDDEPHNPKEGFFADLQAKNDMFGSTLEIDARKLAQKLESASEWHRGDDDVFVGKAAKRMSRSKSRDRHAKSFEIDSKSQEPATEELHLQIKKRGRIMASLTKKR